jgi:uncharacterized protein (TIGR02145 family)
MHKLLLTTAAVAVAICLAGCGWKNVSVSKTSNSLTDKRDGQTYRTVKIGQQTWMAQNLNYKTDNSWCYGNSDDNCEKYGRLYNWNTATTACPAGWKLPDTADWRMLVTTAGGQETAGKKLKSKSGWDDYQGQNGNGTDDYGFSALPGGYRSSDEPFRYAGNYGGNWWTATEDDDNSAYYLYMNYYIDGVGGWNRPAYKSGGLSVRCIADRP